MASHSDILRRPFAPQRPVGWRRRRLLVAAAIAGAAGLAAVGTALATTSGSTTPAAAVKEASATPARVEVGPGPIASLYRLGGFRIQLRDTPNRASKAGTISVALSKDGKPADGAHVKVTLTMLDMAMGSLSAVLPQTAPGQYRRPGPILGMSGHWQITIEIKPHGARTLDLAVVDRVAQ